MQYTINGVEYMTRVGDIVAADGFLLSTPHGKALSVLYFLDEESRCPLGWEVAKDPTPSHFSSAFRKSCMMLGRIPDVVRVDENTFRNVFFSEDDFNDSMTIVECFAECDIDYSYRSLTAIHYLGQQYWNREGITQAVERIFEHLRNGRQYHNHLAGRTPRDVFESGRCPMNIMTAKDIGTMNWLWRNETDNLAAVNC